MAAIGVVIVWFVGLVTGVCFGFVWRPVYDAWFSRLWRAILRRFHVDLCAVLGHRWIGIADVYRVCTRCEQVDPVDWEAQWINRRREAERATS